MRTDLVNLSVVGVVLGMGNQPAEHLSGILTQYQSATVHHFGHERGCEAEPHVYG